MADYIYIYIDWDGPMWCKGRPGHVDSLPVDVPVLLQ